MPTAAATRNEDLARELEALRPALVGYCYRMLGSGFEAEDAVQETMVRAWRNLDKLEAQAALKSWLYRIATNVCLDMADRPQRRARPMDLGPSSTAEGLLDAGRPEYSWVLPVSDERLDPAEVAASRETIRLAFVAALQHLPARQRVVLILREVLRWSAAEVAELLGTSVASVNSALQRARAAMDQLDLHDGGPAEVDDAEQQDFLARYVDAFEAYDMDALVQLLHDDVKMDMPPYELWLEGPDQVGAWMVGQGAGCKGGKFVPTRANGCPAVALYRVDPEGGWKPFNIGLLEIRDGGIKALHYFLFPDLFPAFGLPTRFEADGTPVYGSVQKPS